MKQLRFIMLILIIFTLLAEFTSPVFAQKNKVRKSLKASIMQRLGVDTDVTFKFSRPGVKGRTIWGDVVPYGMYPGNKYSKDKPYPWRAGANENTTIEVSNDVMIEGRKLPKGKYGIHMIASKKEWTVIFSKKYNEWGSFSYNKKNDALRISVIPEKAPHQEWLTFGFDNLEGTAALAFLHWEKLKIPFRIAVVK